MDEVKPGLGDRLLGALATTSTPTTVTLCGSLYMDGVCCDLGGASSSTAGWSMAMA